MVGPASSAKILTSCKKPDKRKGTRGSLLISMLQCMQHVLIRSLVAATAAAVTAAARTATTTVAAATGAVTAAAVAAATGTATAKAATASTTAEAARAGRTWFHRTGFVHYQATAAKLLTVHGVDGGLCLSVTAHFHKAEAFGTASVTFHHDFGAGNGTVCGERLLQVFVTERIRQVAYVKFVAHGWTPQNNSKRDGVLNRNQQTIEDLKQTRN